MATVSQRPGVYINETLLAESTTAAQSSALEAFVGSLPQGPLVPTLVSSWQTFKTKFGGFVAGTTNTVALAVYQFFANGGAQCYVVRAEGAAAVEATRTWKDTATTPVNALTLTASNPGTWANQLYVEVLAGSSAGYVDLRLRIVPSGSTVVSAPVVETWADVSLNPADPHYVLRMLNDPLAGSSYVTASLASGYTYTANDAVALSTVAGGDPLTGGTDVAPALGATGDYITAVTALNKVQQPFVLNLPAITDSATINAVITYIDGSLGGRGDVFLVIDTDPSITPAQAVSAAAAYTATSYGAVYYPRVTVPDPTTTVAGATTTVAPGGAVLGQYATTDTNRGVFKSPAGLSNRIAGALAVETVLTNSDLDSLNAAGVNAIRYQPGSGICIMGARTLMPSPADKYIAVRRTLIFVESQLQLLTTFAVFEPNDSLLWTHLTSVCSNMLLQLWQSGGLAGASQSEAFFVTCDASNNTAQSIAAGQVNIQVGVALEYPAEFVIINIGQTQSGSTVTEAS